MACCLSASNWISRIARPSASSSPSWSRTIFGSMLGDPFIPATSSYPPYAPRRWRPRWISTCAPCQCGFSAADPPPRTPGPSRGLRPEGPTRGPGTPDPSGAPSSRCPGGQEDGRAGAGWRGGRSLSGESADLLDMDGAQACQTFAHRITGWSIDVERDRGQDLHEALRELGPEVGPTLIRLAAMLEPRSATPASRQVPRPGAPRIPCPPVEIQTERIEGQPWRAVVGGPRLDWQVAWWPPPSWGQTLTGLARQRPSPLGTPLLEHPELDRRDRPRLEILGLAHGLLHGQHVGLARLVREE